MSKNLIAKYNVPGPRYTSYPTVPYWDKEGIPMNQWKQLVERSFKESNLKEGISVYIHLPYCESLCTFCGCNKRITKNHSVESKYIEALSHEWDMYCQFFGDKPMIKEIHLGGGTPTFFSPENLKLLIESILKKGDKCEDVEFSFEGHPDSTTRAHLEILYSLGFRRISFGIQDFDPVVQKVIHRIQPFEKVKEFTDLSRQIGFKSVNYDIIYGLPHQTKESIVFTIDQIKKLAPDRIAFYSYAHVPWIGGLGQRKFTESDLPSAEEKRALYELGKNLLEEIGYIEIGMDHFALKSDSLYDATLTKLLHRNFMGYSSSSTQLMIGLGSSSISDAWYGFAQNLKTVEEYISAVMDNTLPIFRGHGLTPEDLVLRRHILNIMCHFSTHWDNEEMYCPELDNIKPRLEELSNDGLITLKNNHLELTPKGRPFIRNICMAFDARLMRDKPKTPIFSMTI